MTAAARRSVRCAIYTRVSTESGLDQDFNSLDAVIERIPNVAELGRGQIGFPPSFLELGRTKPSREMVEQIASALDIPLRQHNALLVAAGYAPVLEFIFYFGNLHP